VSVKHYGRKAKNVSLRENERRTTTTMIYTHNGEEVEVCTRKYRTEQIYLVIHTQVYTKRGKITV
jgi:Mor family transcriptional regulator